MSEAEQSGYRKLKKLAAKTNRQLKELKADSDRESPVDVDMIKTTKAMFYEYAIEIFKEVKKQEERE